jgi:hypothetical protein
MKADKDQQAPQKDIWQRETIDYDNRTVNDIEVEQISLELSRPAPVKEKSILEKFKFLPLFMFTRTELCKHKHGCYENMLRGWYKAFVYSYLLKLVLSRITRIIRPTKFLKALYNS